MHPGGAEQDVRLHAVQIPLPDTQLAAQFFQLQNLRVQLFPGGLITAGYVAAIFQQQPHQGAVADPKAQHGDFFMFQGRKVFFKFAVHNPFLIP